MTSKLWIAALMVAILSMASGAGVAYAMNADDSEPRVLITVKGGNYDEDDQQQENPATEFPAP